MADELDILRPKTQFSFYKNTAKEFPIPFNFSAGSYAPSMNRAERRRTEREDRKMAKKRTQNGPKMRNTLSEW